MRRSPVIVGAVTLRPCHDRRSHWRRRRECREPPATPRPRTRPHWPTRQRRMCTTCRKQRRARPSCSVTGDTGPDRGDAVIDRQEQRGNGDPHRPRSSERPDMCGEMLPAWPTFSDSLSAEATTYTNKWLSFPTGNQAIGRIGQRPTQQGCRRRAQDVRTLLVRPRHNNRRTSGPGGARDSSVDSTGKKVATTLYVQSGSTPRPLQEVTTSTPGKTSVAGSVTFSNWGQQTHVSKPSHAVSLLSLAPAG